MTRRDALTLVEVLVLIVIVGILCALLLPATRTAREYSRNTARINARNNLIGDAHAKADQRSRAAAVGASEVKAKLVYFQDAATDPRKIIYEAQISLVVKDISKTETEITRLLKQFNGYVAESSVDRLQGEEMSGHWRVRILAEQFDPFLEAVSKLGIVENRRQSAQDVTEEFVDLEAQIDNKKRLEERILELLTKSDGVIKDVIEVERELARVRGEIERAEGRLRYLTNRTELTTVTINARELNEYVPPKPLTFADRIRQAWNGSLMSLQTFGERLAVAAVFASPWIVLASAIAVPPFWYFRRRNAHKSALPNGHSESSASH